MHNKFIFIGFILLFFFSGCAVSDDPRQGGLLGYWHGTSSGKYEERHQEKLQQLEEQKRAQQQLTEQSEQLNTEIAIQDQKLAQEQKLNLRLERQLSNLQKNIDTLQLTSEKQRKDAAALKTEIEKTRQSIETQKTALIKLDNAGGSAADPNQARILEQERDRLADEYRKLNVYYQALSNAVY